MKALSTEPEKKIVVERLSKVFLLLKFLCKIRKGLKDWKRIITAAEQK